MPSLKAFGTRWSMSSDAIPLVAFLGLVFHVVWIILIIVGMFIVTKPSECHSTQAAAHYLAMVLLFWCFYIIAAAVETGLMIVGFQGRSMQVTRHRLCAFLYTRSGQVNKCCRDPSGDFQKEMDKSVALHPSLHLAYAPRRTG